ncbi:MAG: TolC family protein, partial [Maricaulaceae bacterium]
MHRLLPQILCVSLLSACASMDIRPEKTDVSPNVPVSPTQDQNGVPTSSWSGVSASDLPKTDWVAEFSDEKLSGLVAKALAANTDIRVAESRYRAALARVDISKSDLLPSVSGSTGVSRSEYGNDNISGRTGLSAGVNASWEFDLWGRIRDGVDASTLEVAASEADYAGVRLAIAARVSQTWF